MSRTHLKLPSLRIARGCRRRLGANRRSQAFPAARRRHAAVRHPGARRAGTEDHKVEVMVGKTLQVDCNRQMFSAKVTQKVAQGWGFPYYVVGQLKGPASTMMACPPDAPKREEFVRANARSWDCCGTTPSCRSSSTHPKASRSASAFGALREPPRTPNRNEARASAGAGQPQPPE